MLVNRHHASERELAIFAAFRVMTPFFYWLSSKIATLPISLSWHPWHGVGNLWGRSQRVSARASAMNSRMNGVDRQ
jgi:hypothetical protein